MASSVCATSLTRCAESIGCARSATSANTSASDARESSVKSDADCAACSRVIQARFNLLLPYINVFLKLAREKFPHLRIQPVHIGSEGENREQQQYQNELQDGHGRPPVFCCAERAARVTLLIHFAVHAAGDQRAAAESGGAVALPGSAISPASFSWSIQPDAAGRAASEFSIPPSADGQTAGLTRSGIQRDSKIACDGGMGPRKPRGRPMVDAGNSIAGKESTSVA